MVSSNNFEGTVLMNNQDSKFARWLELNDDLAEKTIRNYDNAIKKKFDDLARSNITELSRENIIDPKKLKKIKDDYFSIPENEALDKRGNRMYSAAFNKFIFFKNLKDLHQSPKKV